MTTQQNFNLTTQHLSEIQILNKDSMVISSTNGDLSNDQYLNDDYKNYYRNNEKSFNEKITDNDEIYPEENNIFETATTNGMPKSIECKHRIRFQVALLGLAIAVVNCYAQATFCISIVEMVLPADFVFKSESGESIVKVMTNKSTVIDVDPIAFEDQSCPVEYQYREYYDSWRFSTTNSSIIQPSKQFTANMIDTSNRFEWDASRQGILLGAFAVGTAPLQVLAGRLAEIYGAKWVLLAGCIGTAITNLTIPFLAHFSFSLLIINRVVMGIAQAGMEPGLMCLLAEWMTPSETGFFISMLLFAICIGFFLGSLCSSFILTLGYGWPTTYYVAGGMNLIVSIVWLIYASSRPKDSKILSPEELEYIEREQKMAKVLESKRLSCNNDLNKDWKQNISTTTQNKRIDDSILMDSTIDKLEEADIVQKVSERQNESKVVEEYNDTCQAPWVNILSTRSVWAFIICKISIRWCADVLAIELPTYLANVLHLSIKLNGILNSVSSALFAIFSFITGYLVNEILKSHQKNEQQTTDYFCGIRISKTNLRKLFQSVASFGSAITVFLMTRYDCNILFSMSMLLILSSCIVMGTGGELQIPYDMTSRYPGTLHGMACTLSVSGWLAPPLIGLILGDQPSSRYRWSIVWYLTALINLIGGLVFVLFADASPRDFDRNPKNKNKHLRQDEDGNRGRHLASYYNIACKSDNSPPRVTRQPHFLDKGGAKDDLNWSYFDRELIKIRQVEESFIKPSYLHDFDSIAGGQAIVIPYRTKQRHILPISVNGQYFMSRNNEDQINKHNLVRRLCTRIKGGVGRKKFSVEGLSGLTTNAVVATVTISPVTTTTSLLLQHSSSNLDMTDVLSHRHRQSRQPDNPVNGCNSDQQLVTSPMAASVSLATKTITHL